MKKSVSIALCAGTLLLVTPGPALADGPQLAVTSGPAAAVSAPLALPASNQQDGLPGPAQVWLDGEAISTDPASFYKDGQVWVPVREIWEMLGATVTYDQATQSVRASRDAMRAGLVVGRTQAFVGATSVDLPAAPEFVGGRAFAPLSFVTGSLGAKMTWDGQAAKVESGLPAGAVSRSRRLPAVLQKVVDLSRSLLGIRYRWGGTSPKSGFDCSGFISYVAKSMDVELPRTSFEMFRVGQPVPRDQLRPGDLVFFNTYAAGASHAGIYLGNGQFIHANSTGGRVRITDLESAYYARRYLGARRIFDVGSGS